MLAARRVSAEKVDGVGCIAGTASAQPERAAALRGSQSGNTRRKVVVPASAAQCTLSQPFAAKAVAAAKSGAASRTDNTIRNARNP